tara:strand:+ start:524 stop:1879 length:1356 start_codon:yes stop_codon:yes gene_type:complete
MGNPAIVQKGIGFFPKLFNFGNRIINTTIIGSWIDALTGGNVGNLINKYIFGKETRKENQNNLGLNDKVLNLKNTGIPTQGGALKFLGDGGKKLDDAPDIVPTNQSVLDSIAINQGLAMGNTMVPEIDNTSSTESGFAGLREEIDKINQNIQAIATAMLTSASIEGSYRQELLDDLERALVNKGKVRSQTRTERSIFNTITKQKDKIVTRTGSLANNVANALALSIGLEAASGIKGLFDKKEDEELTKEEEEKRINTILVGDPEKEKPKGFMRGLLGTLDFITSDEYDFDNMGRFMFGMGENLKKKRDEASEEKRMEGDEKLKKLFPQFFPKVKNKVNEGEQNSSEVGAEVNLNESPVIKSEEKGDVFNLNQQEGDKDLSQSISAISNNIAFSPLESMSGTTQIIDLRTAQEVSGQSGTNMGGSSTVVDSEIADLDPERRSSPYEVLVRSV